MCDFVCISSVKAVEFLSHTSSNETSTEVSHCLKPCAQGFILRMRVHFTHALKWNCVLLLNAKNEAEIILRAFPLESPSKYFFHGPRDLSLPSMTLSEVSCRSFFNDFLSIFGPHSPRVAWPSIRACARSFCSLACLSPNKGLLANYHSKKII